jgi:hypothetical protein
MSERASSNAAFDQPALEPCRDPGVRPELRIPDGAAQTRMVSVARIRPDSRKSVRPFKGIICADISEFESYMPSQAVVSLWGGTGSVAVVGPNGAGKSMLLKVLAGNRGYNTPQLLQSLRICPVPGRQQAPSI